MGGLRARILRAVVTAAVDSFSRCTSRGVSTYLITAHQSTPKVNLMIHYNNVFDLPLQYTLHLHHAIVRTLCANAIDRK